jgi:Protein of unknown function (DUF1566)/Domain of unknown function (DUF4515)
MARCLESRFRNLKWGMVDNMKRFSFAIIGAMLVLGLLTFAYAQSENGDGKTVADAIKEYQEIKTAQKTLDRRYAEEYAAQTKPIDDHYNQKIKKATPIKDQFETIAQFQERKTVADRIIADLNSEKDKKKLETQNRIRSVIESEKEPLENRLAAIEKITEPLPRTALKFRLGEYFAESASFSFTLKVATDVLKNGYWGYVEIPAEKARIYHADPSLLAPEAIVGIKNGHAMLAEFLLYGPKEGEKYTARDMTPAIWVDRGTGLAWQVLPTGERMTQADAAAHCDGLYLGGFNDWRSPTFSELKSLIRGVPDPWNGHAQKKKGGPGEGGAYWPRELKGVCAQYWSSTPYAHARNSGRFVRFSTAYHNVVEVNYAKFFARCVR